MEDLHQKHLDEVRAAMSQLAVELATAFEGYQQRLLAAQQALLDEALRRMEQSRAALQGVPEAASASAPSNEQF